jgi:cytochrome c oxidase cbb3-type subunit 3
MKAAAVVLALALLASTACAPPGKPDPYGEEAVEGNISDFPTLFARNCAGCHGAEGHNGPGRILNDPLYLAVIPKEELRNTIVHGRPGTSMPAWAKSEGGSLTDHQIDVLVGGIEKNWTRPQLMAGRAPLPPYSAPLESGDAKRGKILFATSCVLCHRPGVIGPVTVPAYLTLVSNQNLRTSVIVGRPDLGMPSYRNLKAGKPLSDQDISDLVTYLASLRPENQVSQDAHTVESGTGQSGPQTKGNEGSGNVPGRSRDDQRQEGPKAQGNNSQQGGVNDTHGEQPGRK